MIANQLSPTTTDKRPTSSHIHGIKWCLSFFISRRISKARTVKIEFSVGYAIVTAKSIRPLKLDVSFRDIVRYSMYAKNRPVPKIIREITFLSVLWSRLLYVITSLYIRNPYAD